MRNSLIAIALIACTVLAGCAQENVKQALDNLSKDCDRHYTFSVSSGGVGGVGASAMISGTADCKHEFGDVTAGSATKPAPSSPPSQ